MQVALVTLLCVYGIALSLKSVVVLGRAAGWTSAGWWFTILYFVAVIAKSTVTPALSPWGEYALLAGVTLTFIVAGIRDEPQAEPWWWPTRRSATRLQKRRTG